MGDIISAFLMITRSIVQGSGLGPYLFILLARKLRTLSLINRLVKYADDNTLVVPQHTDCLIDAELQNIVNWSEINKQNINTNKTKEIIFWKSGRPPKVTTVPAIPQIKRVQQVKLLGGKEPRGGKKNTPEENLQYLGSLMSDFDVILQCLAR